MRSHETDRWSFAAHPEGWWAQGEYRAYNVGTADASRGLALHWQLLVDVKFEERSGQAVEQLQGELQQLTAALPTRALLKCAARCNIFVNRESGRRGAEVHWVPKLPTGARAPPWAARPNTIEINSWGDHNSNCLSKRDALLHELAHVYNGEIGRDCSQVDDLYEYAVKGKLYESVRTRFGPDKRAYGLCNALEMFASLSVPLFGGENDYWPFRFADLLQGDPGALERLVRIWGLVGDELSMCGCERGIRSLDSPCYNCRQGDSAAVNVTAT